MRRCVVAALALGLAEGVASPLKWVDCTFQGSDVARPVRFDCAALRVPFCHAPCGRDGTHELQLLRRQTTTADAPVVWVATTFENTTATAEVMECVASLNGGSAVNVYALQTRLSDLPLPANATYDGTGCHVLMRDFRDSLSIDSAMLDAARRCREWVDAEYGREGLSAFSLTNAASDLAAGLDLVQTQELQSNASVFLLAVGEASRVVQRLMAVNTTASAKIAGFIFDTPSALELKPDQDATSGVFASRFLEGCDSDETCRTKFASISMTEVLAQAYEKLDKAPETATTCMAQLRDAAYDSSRDLKPSHGIRRYMADQREDPTRAKFVAPLLYRMHRCNEDDRKMVEEFVEKKVLTVSDAAKIKARATFATFANRVVSYSELWSSPPPTRESLVRSFETSVVGKGDFLYQQPSFCVYTASESSACKGVYTRTPVINTSTALTYPAPTTSAVVYSSNGLVATSASDVLILASRLNLVGSYGFAEELYSAYSADQEPSQTAIFVQTDTLSTTEFNREVPEALLQLVGGFVTKNAKPFQGKWYIGDLTPATATPTKSTFSTAPVAVSFSISAQEMRDVLSTDASDPYEYELVHKRRPVDGCAEGCDGEKKFYYTIGFVTAALFLVTIFWKFKGRICRRRAQPELPQPPPTTSQPHTWYAPAPLAHPEPIQQHQWVAHPVNDYTNGYTRRPNPAPY